MRQAGILASAGLFALQNNIDRLKVDHANAKKLEDVVSKQKWARRVLPVETNIVVFELNQDILPTDFITKMNEKGIRLVSFGGQLIRMVTHLDISEEMMEYTIRKLQTIEL